jgi:DNA-binding LacI/PurR family transcriptional regulator
MAGKVVRMPTLDDVARAAGVSRGTVSNVFNRPDVVRLELRERVMAAAQTLGYGGPDPKGRLLKEGRFNAVGFMPPGAFAIADVLRSPYGRELVLGVAQACDEAGATLSMVNGANDRRVASIREALVDGFILGTSADIEVIRSLRHRRLPFVILESDAGADVSSIRIDGRTGAIAAVTHLAGLGHRKFAILSIRRTSGPPLLHPPSQSPRHLQEGFALDQERLDGFRDALAEAGLSLGDMPIIETTPGDPLAGATVFDNCPEATAIVTMSDWQAFTILDEARRRGIDIPGHVSVIGFDGTGEASRSVPPLTTVAHDIVGKGRLAARMILDNAPARQIVQPVQLVVRESTAPPRTGETSRSA